MVNLTHLASGDLDVFVFDRFDDYVNAVEKGKTQSQEKQQ